MALNIYMNKYIATVRVKGQAIKMTIFADSQIHARLIFQHQFGMNSIISSPNQISEVKLIKPLTSDQLRIKAMQARVKQDQQAVKAEKARQMIAKGRLALAPLKK